MYRNFYERPEWRQLRKEFLEEQGGLCSVCFGRDFVEVRHKLTLKTHPELSLTKANLVAICGLCVRARKAKAAREYAARCREAKITAQAHERALKRQAKEEAKAYREANKDAIKVARYEAQVEANRQELLKTLHWDAPPWAGHLEPMCGRDRALVAEAWELMRRAMVEFKCRPMRKRDKTIVPRINQLLTLLPDALTAEECLQKVQATFPELVQK
jgi:hypothetical protein